MYNAKTDHLIWSNDPSLLQSVEEFKANAIADGTPELVDGLSDEQILDIIQEDNDDTLIDEKANLNITLTGNILIIARLGLWNGSPTAYRQTNTNNIGKALSAGFVNGQSYSTIYVTNDGCLCQDEAHHDGTNHYEYRVIRARSMDNIDQFLDLIYDQKATAADIKKYTRELGQECAKVYDWNFDSHKRKEA